MWANAETGIGYDKREGNKKAGETPCGVLRCHGTAQIIWPYKWIFNWCWIYNEVMCQMPGYYQITIYSTILLIVFILRSKLFEDYQPRLAFSKKDRSWVAFPNSNRPIVTHFKQERFLAKSHYFTPLSVHHFDLSISNYINKNKKSTPILWHPK